MSEEEKEAQKADVLILIIALEIMPILWPNEEEIPFLNQVRAGQDSSFNMLDTIRRGANKPETY